MQITGATASSKLGEVAQGGAARFINYHGQVHPWDAQGRSSNLPLGVGERNADEDEEHALYSSRELVTWSNDGGRQCLASPKTHVFAALPPHRRTVMSVRNSDAQLCSWISCTTLKRLPSLYLSTKPIAVPRFKPFVLYTLRLRHGPIHYMYWRMHTTGIPSVLTLNESGVPFDVDAGILSLGVNASPIRAPLGSCSFI